MAAVDEDCQLDTGGSAEIAHRVQRRPDGAAGKQDIVDEYHRATGDVGRDVGTCQTGSGSGGQVVAIQTYVQLTDWHGLILDGLDGFCDAAGKGNATGVYPHENDVSRPRVAFHNLVADATDRPIDVLGVHHPGHAPPRTGKCSKLVSPFRPHWTGLKVGTGH